MQALNPRPIAVAKPALFRRPAISAGSAMVAGEAVAVFALAVVTVATRLAVRTQYLFNWDAIQFALGVQRFDLAAHRPHPPGYLGYILLGRVLTGVSGGNAETGLVLLSALAEGLAVALAYYAARDLWSRFAGCSAMVLLLTSPLTWFYGATALTYALEPALAVLVLWLAVRAVRGDGRALVLAAVVAAVAGAVRPTDELFLAVPVGWAAWRCRHSGRTREVHAAATALLVATTAWVVPLMVMSGGVARYLVVSRELSARASETSAVWNTGLYGLQLNGGAAIAGLGLALGLAAPIGLAHLLARGLPQLTPAVAPVDRDYTLAAAALTGPALAVYVLVHIGQLGYILLLVPALVLPAGVIFRSLAVVLAPRHAGAVAAAMLVACAAGNVATFALPADGLRNRLTQHDASVGDLLALVRTQDPATTLVVTSAEASGSYRMVAYYLPGYQVMAIGKDSSHHAGEMFASHLGSGGSGAPEYDLARFARAAQPRFPTGVRTVLVLDRDAAHLVGDFSRLSPLMYGDGNHAWSATLAPGERPVASAGFIYLSAADCPCRGTSAPTPAAASLHPR